MMVKNLEQLREVTEAMTPKLEHVLSTGAIAARLRTKNMPAELVLRSGVCKVASRVLGAVLLRSYGLNSDVEWAEHLVRLPGGQEPVSMPHARLLTRDKAFVIDASYGQFVNLVGVVPGVVKYREDLWDSLPDPKIAVFERGNPGEYIDRLTDAAFQLDQLNINKKPMTIVPRGTWLAGASRKEMRDRYSILMHAENYQRTTGTLERQQQYEVNDAAERMLAL